MNKLFIFFVFIFFLSDISAQPPSGFYTATGHMFGTSSSPTLNQPKAVTLVAPNTYEVQSDLNYYTFRFQVDASNHLVNWTTGSGMPPVPASGFMTQDNPGNFTFAFPGPILPGTSPYIQSIYNNTYDPVTQTFYMHYGYKTGSTGQAGYQTQVYEKWVFKPAPDITSITPLTGTAFTQVSIRGNHLADLGDLPGYNIYFGTYDPYNIEYIDTLLTISDTLLTVQLGKGATGNAWVSNEYESDSFPGFTYTPLPRATDLQWQYLGTPGFSLNRANEVSGEVDHNNNPVLVFINSVSRKTMVMKYTAGNWVNIGSPVSDGGSSRPKIILDNSDNPVVAYIDSLNSNFWTVKKYTGTSWISLPGLGLNNRLAWCIDRNNIIYLAGYVGGYVNVYKYTGSSWTTFSHVLSNATEYDMTIDTMTNTPYIVYGGGSYGEANVVKLSGSSWIQVGSANFSNPGNYIEYPTIRVDKNSNPVVVFVEDFQYERLSAYRFTGTSWARVGNGNFTKGRGYEPGLAFDSNNNPFVLFTDVAYENRGTVRTFSPLTSQWDTVGPRGFMPGKEPVFHHSSIMVGSNNLAFVAFSDVDHGNKASVMTINTGCYNNLNTWLGTADNAWENPANWSCGAVPQPSSNVVIPTGSVVVLSTNAIINTLHVLPGASFTVAAGVNLTITHP